MYGPDEHWLAGEYSPRAVAVSREKERIRRRCRCRRDYAKEAARVYDASGHRMAFQGAVKLSLQVDHGEIQWIAFLVDSAKHGMILLGTNALPKLVWKLMPDKSLWSARTKAEESKKKPGSRRGMHGPVQQHNTKSSKEVTVAGSVSQTRRDKNDLCIVSI
ncbi:unnamed protein product [Nippostrongylus brasiliensis]|uniref:AP2/ERF domain-containing protein n=1 Tax=Nippostrongylus brasiliensis TaxID=27835 RepID=A0A0N4Y8K4_NIPBR|nr:unnamed protein product [Nippostrongylus brasiliensis]